MARNYSDRFNELRYVSPVVRSAWFTLTVILILPVFEATSEPFHWLVLFPLLSILTALAGIFGVYPKSARSKRSRVAGARDQEGALIASVR